MNERGLFLVGLSVYAAGQGLITMGRDFVDGLQPVDLAHWALVVGAVMLLPYAARMPKTRIAWIAGPLLIIGVAGIVGMCVVDFLIWSYGPGPERDAFIRHAVAEPAIWTPFMVVGPWLFGLGIALASLSYVEGTRSGPAIVIVASVITAVSHGWPGVLGNVLLVVGYAICFGALSVGLKTGSDSSAPRG